MARYFLVGCSKEKRFNRGNTAACAYRGHLFWLETTIIKWAREVAEQQNQPIPGWSIVSAKYGLLQPTDEIEDYDLHIKQLKKPFRLKWAHQVAKDLFRVTGGRHKQVILFMGAAYANLLEPELLNLGYTVERPLQGKSIGPQLQWCNRELNRLYALNFELGQKQISQLHKDLELREELA